MMDKSQKTVTFEAVRILTNIDVFFHEYHTCPGGWVPYEIDKLIQCGFQPVHMGPRILRVETAVTALLARLF